MSDNLGHEQLQRRVEHDPPRLGRGALAARALDAPPTMEGVGVEMTPAALKQLCRKDSLFSTPHLNDKLYLHYKGFREIAGLGEYTGLRVLWLEGNGFTRIAGLDAQADMRTLYLQENAIARLENLGHMAHLGTLNVSKNRIQRIEGLEALAELTTLQISHNDLVTAEDVAALATMPLLACVDLSENRLEDVAVVDVLEASACALCARARGMRPHTRPSTLPFRAPRSARAHGALPARQPRRQEDSPLPQDGPRADPAPKVLG